MSFRPKLPLLSLCVFAAGGCTVPYLLRQADADLEAGRVEAALSHYDAALRTEIREGEPLRAEVEQRRQRACAAVLAKALARSEELSAAGSHAAALDSADRAISKSKEWRCEGPRPRLEAQRDLARLALLREQLAAVTGDAEFGSLRSIGRLKAIGEAAASGAREAAASAGPAPFESLARDAAEAQRKAAGTLARAQIAEAEKQLAGGQAEAAFLRLEELAARAGELGLTDVAPVLQALQRAAETIWPRVDAALQPSSFPTAVALAARLAAPFPSGHPVAQRFAAVRARAAQFHGAQAEAAGDRQTAAQLHLQLATAAYGAERPARLDSLTAQVRGLTSVAWKVSAGAIGQRGTSSLSETKCSAADSSRICSQRPEFVAPPDQMQKVKLTNYVVGERLADCAAFVRDLKEYLPQEGAVTVEVTVSPKVCKQQLYEWSYHGVVGRESYLADGEPIKEQRWEMQNEPKQVWENGRLVWRHDSKMVAVETTRIPKVTKYRDSYGERWRAFTPFRFEGTVRASWADGVEEFQAAVDGAATYPLGDWSNGSEKPPPRREELFEAARDGAQRRVSEKLLELTGRINAARLQKAVARARAAAARGDAIGADDGWAEAVLLNQAMLPEAERWFSTRLGLSGAQVLSALRGEALTLRASLGESPSFALSGAREEPPTATDEATGKLLELPPANQESLADREALRPIGPAPERAAESYFAGQVVLSGGVRQSPVDRELGRTVRLQYRDAARLTIDLEGPLFGGRSRGMAVAGDFMTPVDRQTLKLNLGAALAAHTAGDGREANEIDATASLYWAVFSWLDAETSVKLNLLQLRDNGVFHPSSWNFGLVLRPTSRLFVEGSASYLIGKNQDPKLWVLGCQLGVSL